MFEKIKKSYKTFNKLIINIAINYSEKILLKNEYEYGIKQNKYNDKNLKSAFV